MAEVKEALENLRLHARRELTRDIDPDDGHLTAMVDVATLASTLLEILGAVEKVRDDQPALILKDAIDSEIRIAVTMRGWNA